MRCMNCQWMRNHRYFVQGFGQSGRLDAKLPTILTTPCRNQSLSRGPAIR